MQRTALVASILLLAGACGDSRDTGGAPSEAPTPGPSADALPAAAASSPPLAPAQKPAGRSEKVSSALFEFEYAYPAAVGALPGLKALLDKRLEIGRAQLEKEAKADQAEAKKNDYPYRAHSSGTTWQVVTNLPRWLSLSADQYTYSGGAHGMTFFDGLVWDKQQNRAIKPIDLFSSKAALSGAIRDPFCDALDKERARRRGEPVQRDNGDTFNECIDPAASTLILGSSNGRTFDRIGVLIEPYAAGAYAEGTFDLTLPATDAVIAAVKPEYRSAFATR